MTKTRSAKTYLSGKHPRWRGIGLTDVGCIRPTNEDCFVVNNRAGLYIVADGMGGAPGGDVASKLVVEQLSQLVRKSLARFRDFHDVRCQARLQETFCAVNDLICREGNARSLIGMGATVVLAYLRGMTALIAHIGDSRCYLYRDGQIKRLTKDHTTAQQLLERGEISSSDAEEHPLAHELTKVLGSSGVVQADISMVDLQDGDKLLLCSDGLLNIPDVQIAGIMEDSVAKICGRLIEQAKTAGGEDNITAVVVAQKR